MPLPRMRTAAGVLAIIKEQDPSTEVTLHYIRQLINTGKVTVTPVGTKKLVDANAVISYIATGEATPSCDEAPVSFDLPDIMGGGHVGFSLPALSEIQLPRLATGAVIPPNREFMAILGDQKSGMNVEAPESLLRQMANDDAGMNTGLLQKILDAILSGKIMVVDSAAFAKVVYAANKSESNRHGTSLVVR